METGNRGQVILLFALMLLILIGVAGLAVDVGYFYTVRAELQRAADSGALAGAGEFRFYDWAQGDTKARADGIARNYAMQHIVVQTALDNAEIAVTFPDSDRIRVDATRTVDTFFTRFLLGPQRVITAYAVAEAREVSQNARCVVPWGIPAPWAELGGDPYRYDAGVDQLHLPGEEESWGGCDQFGDVITHYSLETHSIDNNYPVSARDGYPCTGALRVLKVGDPRAALEPGHFFGLDFSSVTTTCSDPSVTINSGANFYKYMIMHPCECDTTLNADGTGISVDVKPGDMVGPTIQAVAPQEYKDIHYIGTTPEAESLMNLDPGADWNYVYNLPDSDQPAYALDISIPAGSAGAGGLAWTTSPRVIRVPIYDPRYPPGTGKKELESIIGFAGFWIQDINEDQGTVIGRLIHISAFGSGGPDPGLFGPKVKALRLVE